MKKILAVILAFAMIFSFAACGEKNNAQPDAGHDVLKIGRLVVPTMTEEEMNQRSALVENIYFDNLNSMLMALDAGKIDILVAIPEVVSKYIANRNENLIVGTVSADNESTLYYHMGIADNNKQIYDIIEPALLSMINDNTLEDLKEQYIDGYVEGNDPESIKIPVIEGADYITVAVTGDLPPMDFVDTNGIPAGYNVAVLAELSKRANVNIEIKVMDSASKLMALQQGNVDLLFWVAENKFREDTDARSYVDVTDGVLLTSAYFADEKSCVKKK